MTWTTNDQPFGVNHAPLMSGLASDGSGVEVPVAVDKDTGEVLVSTSGGGGTSDVNLVSVSSSPITLGLAASAASLPVVVASDQTLSADVNLTSVGGAGYSLGQNNMSASMPVAIASDQSDVPVAVSGNVDVLTPDTTQSGSITSAPSTIVMALNGQSTVGIQVSGTFSATLQVSLSVDGSTYTPTTIIVLTTGAIANTITTATTGQVNTAGMVSLKVSAISYSSGTANVSLRASTSLSTVMLDNSLPAGSNTIGTVNVGTTSASGAVYSNQQNVTASAAALPSHALTQGLTVQALSTNAASIYVGGSGVTTSTGLELPPGSAVTLPVNNANSIFVVAAGTGSTTTFGGV